MKKMWLYSGAGCALVAGLAVSSVALQSQDDWFPERASGFFIHRLELRMGISADQREQIKTILATEQPTIIALARRVQQEQEELHAQSTFDEAYVRSFAEEHASTAEDVLVERERVRSEILQVLTPEQRTKAKQLRQEIVSRSMTRLATLGDQL